MALSNNASERGSKRVRTQNKTGQLGVDTSITSARTQEARTRQAANLMATEAALEKERIPKLVDFPEKTPVWAGGRAGTVCGHDTKKGLFLVSFGFGQPKTFPPSVVTKRTV